MNVCEVYECFGEIIGMPLEQLGVIVLVLILAFAVAGIVFGRWVRR